MQPGKYFFDEKNVFVVYSPFNEKASHHCYELPIGSSVVLVHSNDLISLKRKVEQGLRDDPTYIGAGFIDKVYRETLDKADISGEIRAQLFLLG